MTVAPTFPEPPAPDPDQDRTQVQVRMLRELGDMGMDLARALHAQGLEAAQDAASDPQAGAETGAAELARQAAAGFARVARSVQQTLALENRLSRDLQARAQAAPVSASGPAQAPQLTATDWAERERAMRRISRRAVVLETLVPAIRAETPESEHEQLLADLEERLEAAVEEPDLVEQSLEALTARIRRELGLAEGSAQDAVRIQSVRSAMRAEVRARQPWDMGDGP